MQRVRTSFGKMGRGMGGWMGLSWIACDCAQLAALVERFEYNARIVCESTHHRGVKLKIF